MDACNHNRANSLCTASDEEFETEVLEEFINDKGKPAISVEFFDAHSVFKFQ